MELLIFLSPFMFKALKTAQAGTSRGAIPTRFANYLTQVSLITSYLSPVSLLKFFKLIVQLDFL